MSKKITDLREELDKIDESLLQLLEKRTSVTTQVALRKWQEKLPVYDADREKALLERLRSRGQEMGLDSDFVARVYREILDASVRGQEETLRRKYGKREAAEIVRVVYQGAEGSYSSMAARRHFGPWDEKTEYVGLPTFESVLDAVVCKNADYAVLPIENTTAGSINEAYDLLAAKDLILVGEEVQRVEHCLLGVKDVSLSTLRRVYSHPQALAQCNRFLTSLEGCRVEAFRDTALAAEKVKQDQDPAQAAIASEEAARRFGLVVLQRGIANQEANFTRMVIAAREPVDYPFELPRKTSLIFTATHDRGSLVRALQVFADHNLNLTKLESRPRPQSPWQYLFYVDFEGNSEAPEVKKALAELRTRTSWLKILGTYPAQTFDVPTEGQAGA